MSPFLLDTNVPSELTRTICDPLIERWLEDADDERLFLSAILIAATALEHDLTVVTRNVKDFADLGLVIFNPWEPA